MKWEKGEAIWRQIQHHLLRDITNGIFKPGEKLPTEKELAKRFEVNRHTVRQAIAALTKSNVTKVEQGRGIFVLENALDYELSDRMRFSQNISRRHRLPNKSLVSSLIGEAPESVARHLNLSSKEKIIRIESVSEADGIPLAHAVSYLPEKRFQGIEKVFAETRSLTESFKYFDVNDYTRKSTRIIAQIPSIHIAGLLRQPRSKPVLQTESLDIDMDSIPIEYGITCFSSDRVQFLLTQ